MTKRVLLVDDEETIQALVSVILAVNSGYELLNARDGIEGLDMVRREKPDLVLLDVVMPGKDGYEVCREIKRDPSTRDVLVVMLTASDQDCARQRAMEAGADGYLMKPFSPNALLGKLREVLAMR